MPNKKVRLGDIVIYKDSFGTERPAIVLKDNEYNPDCVDLKVFEQNGDHIMLSVYFSDQGSFNTWNWK